MSASIVYTPDVIPVARASDIIVCYRYNPDGATFAEKYKILPNLRCLGITVREGADPGSARFRYVFGDPLAPASDPQRFEQVFPLDAAGPLVVHGDDRIVVRAFHEDGTSALLMDAFVQVPQADLGPETEAVSFAALGTPVREWDTPLPGAVLRDADAPLTVSDTQTDLPARFNPDGRPNASPVDTATPPAGDSGADPAKYPVFLGPFWPTNKVNGQDVRTWTLAMAARYVIARGASDDNGDPSKYVTYDDLSYLDDLLTAWSPVGGDGTGVLTDGDDTTFTVEDVEAPDLDVTGTAWPEALQRLVEPYGFAVRFALEETEAGEGDDFGDPKWTMKVYWKDGDTPARTLSLQTAGGALDPGRTNLQTLTLARDSAGIANRIAVDAAPVRVEVPLVLAPGFRVDPGDAGTADRFRRGADDFTAAVRDEYRLYIFDECGEGHWSFASGGSWVTTVGDLKPAFADLSDAPGRDHAKRYWALRRREPISTLVSVGDDGKPLQAALFVSFDYAGPQPGVWDGTGAWQELVTGEWRFTEDRLGVYLTANDVDAWAVGDDGTLTQLSDGKVKNVTWTAAPTVPNPYPRYMLLCCVDSDNDFDVTANRRAASTTSFTVTRRVDARERFRKTVVNKWSFYGDLVNDFGVNDRTVTDDEPEAQALADAQRRHSESAVFAGTATIPRLTLAYHVGDKVTDVDGRDVSLRSNLGAEHGESPVYPSVVAVNWNFDGGQSTELTLSDARAEPPPRRGRRHEG